jgi:(S)-2-hydroxyglutarate dehydrogenase
VRRATTSTKAVDVLVIGAGAIGTSVAYHLARSGRSVLVLEKEARVGEHQSARNSGVVHAGYNLKAGSEKARFCAEGSRRLRAYCAEKGVPLDVGGILVVAREEREMETLRELDRRSRANGTDARLLDEAGLRAVEPHAAGIAALHAREGASFDARAYVETLARDAMALGARFEHGARVLAIQEDGVRTADGTRRARVVVNAAGLFAEGASFDARASS